MRKFVFSALILATVSATTACNLGFEDKKANGTGGAGGDTGGAGGVVNCDVDGDGHTAAYVLACQGIGDNKDCDDRSYNPNAFYGAPEVCGDGIDNNCNGVVDEGCNEPTDADGDGESSLTDCDDHDPKRSHHFAEVCGDGIDNNCDGQVDEGCGTNVLSMFLHWMPGFTLNDEVWGKGYVDGTYFECLMNLESSQGPGEELACPEIFNVGAAVNFWVETSNGVAAFWAFDMCDEVGGYCQGKGDWCDPDHMVGSVWWTRDWLYGPVVNYTLTPNGFTDQLGHTHVCWENGGFTVPSP